jgi:hypothetical protein
MVATKIAARAAALDATVVSRDASGVERVTPLAQASAAALVAGRPVREFRMHKNQQHWSGSWWCATTEDLEIYESRLELSRLILADFDPDVADVLSQPFVLRQVVDGKTRLHTPDFLFVTRDRQAVVVDVKHADRVRAPKVAPVLARTREAVEAKGWSYEVWTGAPQARLGNVRFLAGFRLRARIDDAALDAAHDRALPGMTVGEALAAVAAAGAHPMLARPALLHLLWRGDLGFDVDERLSRSSLLMPGSR